jgi:hypothetical protein
MTFTAKEFNIGLSFTERHFSYPGYCAFLVDRITSAMPSCLELTIRGNPKLFGDPNESSYHAVNGTLRVARNAECT